LKTENTVNLDSAIEWIIESGVQDTNGGFYAWYDCEKDCYSFLYPEITGYAIQFLTGLYESTGKNVFLKKAIAAGDWLLKIQRKNGAFYCKYFDGTKKIDKSLYTFDAGICLSGLLSLYDATSDEKYFKSSLNIANWLLKNQNPDGSFIAGYTPDNSVIEDHHWSRTSGCHHLKNLIPLLKLYDVLEDKKFYDSAERLLKWGLGLQSETGRFYVSYKLEETYSHANCYAIEGILKAAKYFENKTPSKHIISASRWLSKVQNDDGSIWNYHNTEKERIKTSEALAQAIRIWILTKKFTDTEKSEFETNIKRGLSFLEKTQCSSGNTHSSGGIFYGQRNGEKIRHVNTWATLFTIQALLFLKVKEKNPTFLDLLY
jgi:uncharacterized protein YyaL (SSP411 family)